MWFINYVLPIFIVVNIIIWAENAYNYNVQGRKKFAMFWLIGSFVWFGIILAIILNNSALGLYLAAVSGLAIILSLILGTITRKESLYKFSLICLGMFCITTLITLLSVLKQF